PQGTRPARTCPPGTRHLPGTTGRGSARLRGRGIRTWSSGTRQLPGTRGTAQPGGARQMTGREVTRPVGTVRGMRPPTRRSALVLTAKVAGALALVALIVIVRPFVPSSHPSSGSNLESYVSGFDAPTFVTAAPGESDRLYVVEQAGRIRYVVHRHIAGTFLDI